MSDRSPSGRFLPGVSSSPDTQFKKGQHWRPRKPHWDREWLQREYVEKQRSTSEIAKEAGCKASNIGFWLKKHGIQARTISASRKVKRWGAVGSANPMFGKTGPLSPRWSGGQRERFSPQSKKWRQAVLERDGYRCSLCHGDECLEVHHIVRFGKDKAKRWEVSNGLTLCRWCHVKFHGREDAYEALLTLLASIPTVYVNFPPLTGAHKRKRKPCKSAEVS